MEPTMKDVYYYIATNQVSFTYIRNECVCIGETDGNLQDWLDWSREDQASRGVFNESRHPTIKSDA